MVRTRTTGSTRSQHLPSQSLERRRRALVATVATIVVATAAAVRTISYKRYFPEEYHTSKLSGSEWMDELLNGHSDRLFHNCGMRQHVFHKLKAELQKSGGLKPRRHVDVDEMLGTFLYQAVTNLSVRRVAERFQRSLETVSRSVLVFF
jgi:hypothetical protein